MLYHYADHENQVLGPVNSDDLRDLYHSGTITAETNVFPEGASDWRPYRELMALPAPPRSLAPVVYAPVVRLEPVLSETKACPFCAEDVSINAKKCKHCGEIIDVVLRAADEAKQSNKAPMVFMNAGGAAASSSAAVSAPPTVVVVGGKSGVVAAVLNLLIPGLGYMYCGRFFLGVFVFLLTVILVPITAGIAALVLYPIFVIDGFLAAGRANRRIIVVR